MSIKTRIQRLGPLPYDYPETLVGLFGVAWGFPSLEPPDYLVALSPGLYEAERARVAARFEEAVQLAEQAFLDEFARLVAHLTERIGGVGEDGQPRVFRDSAVENLREFFDRFRSLNVRSNDQLDALVAEAQRAVRGVGAQDLRDGEALRARVAAPALAGPGVARRDAGRAAPAAHPPAGGRAGGWPDGPRRRPRRHVRAIYSEEIDLAALGPPRDRPGQQRRAGRAPAAGTPTWARCGAGARAVRRGAARPSPPRSPGSSAHWLRPAA